jgi:hypothetical protein
MIVQEHRQYKTKESEGFLIVNTISKEELIRELKEYKDKNPEQKLKCYIHPTRPAKKYLIPEYMMEVRITDQIDNTFMFWETL